MGNVFGRARGRSESRIIIQGLDAAGKTSLLYKMKLGEVVTTIPTIGFNVETIEFRGVSITCWDLGGRDKIRPLYRHYYQNTQGFIYVIDSNDKERLDDALDELVRYIFLEDETRDTVVMVLANKQDLNGALSASHIEKALMDKMTFGKDSTHSVFVLPCSVTAADGSDQLFQAFAYFSQQLRLQPHERPAGLYRPDLSLLTTPAPGPNHSPFKRLFHDPLGLLKALFY